MTAFALASVLFAAAGAPAADGTRLAFPVPGHPDYTQNLHIRTFDFLQKEKRAFAYSYKVRCVGMDPDTPRNNSNLGMTLCVRYMDGAVKWLNPEAAPSPAESGWQEISGVFEPRYAISNATAYLRIARKGEAWFKDLSLSELAAAEKRGPCRLSEKDGVFILENDFTRVAIDPAHGGTATSLVLKKDGADRAASAPLFADAFEGRGSSAGRAYTVIRRRDTPGSAEVTLSLTGPEGHPFVEIEKTFRVSRYEDGVEVKRVYRNLPAAMGPAAMVPEGEARMEIPPGGFAERTRVFFGSGRATDGAADAPAKTAPPFSLELSRELVTPHTPWLVNYAGGATRALFILDIRQQREIVELAQRMDLDARTVRIAEVRENMAWGMIERYGTYDFSDANDAVRNALETEKFDAIVIAGRLWDRLDPDNRERILAALRAGTGLVAVQNAKLVPDGYREIPDGAAYAKGGIPDVLLPFGADRVKSFANGASRAILLDYNAFNGLTPFVRYEAEEPGFFYADYALGMIAKSLLWAARKDMAVPADAAADESLEDSGDGLIVRRRIFRFRGKTAGFSCEVSRGESSPEAKARLAARRRELEYPSAAPEPPELPFSVGECCHRNGIKRYLLPLRFAQLKSAGVNQIRFWAVDPPGQYRPYLKYGFGFDFPVASGQLQGNSFQKEFQEPYAKTKDRRFLVRRPCLNDPEYVARDLAKVSAAIDRTAVLKPVSYDCGDENSLTRWESKFDFCFGEHCLAAFRKWLKGEYGSLDALNTCWGTAFARWEDVVPDTTEEARARRRTSGGLPTFAAWADHRRFMEITYAAYFARVRAAVEKKAPGLPFDMSGTQPANGWTGMDFWLMSKTVNLPALYDLENAGEIVRSFNRPFVHPWFGYSAKGKSLAFRAWNDAFRFLDFGISYYHEGLMLMPDYTVAEPVARLAEAIRDLRDGGARLLRSLEPEEEALVHYSQASIHAAQIENRYADFIAARDKWCKRLVATGTQFRFVSYAELETGALDRTRAKLLILPQSAAMSDGEIAAVLRFARRGGRVAGDAFAGAMDGHCRHRADNPLAGTVRRDDGLGDAATDGIRRFEFRSRLGLPGRYAGFTRECGAAPGTAERRIALERKCFVYDMRAKKPLGRVDSFTVSLKPGGAAFLAILPYKVESLRAEGDSSVVLETSTGESGLHPVKIEVFAKDGKPVASHMAEVRGCRGEWKPRLPPGAESGEYDVVYSDFVSGETFSKRMKMR